MKIGELAERTRVPVETIRYYEQTGLLSQAERSPANYRIYTSEHEQQLRLIRNCRSLDLSHHEIRELFEIQQTHSADCSQINHVIRHHLDHVQQRIQQLQILELALEKLSRQCSGQEGTDSCKILEGLSQTLGTTEGFAGAT